MRRLKRLAWAACVVVLGVLLLGTYRQYHPSWPAIALAIAAAGIITWRTWRRYVPASATLAAAPWLRVGERALIRMVQVMAFGLAYLLVQYPVLGTVARHAGTTATHTGTVTGWEPHHRYGRHRGYSCAYVRAIFIDSYGRRTRMSQCTERGPTLPMSDGARVWLVSIDSWWGSLTTGRILMVQETSRCSVTPASMPAHKAACPDSRPRPAAPAGRATSPH